MAMELGIRAMDALVVIILARYLAPEGFGLLAFALSFAGLFGMLPGFGMGSLSVRNVAREPEQLSRFLLNGLIVKTALAALTLLIIWLASILFHHSGDRQAVVMLAGLLMVLETNVTFALSFFQAMQQINTMAFVNLGVRAGWVLSSLGVMFFHGGIGDLLGARIAVTLVGFLVTLGLVHFRLHRLSWKLEPGFAWHILRASLPFALIRVWMELYADVDMVMLSTMKGDVVTSLYAASQKVLRTFSFIPAGFSAANLPEMARSSKDSRAELVRMIARRCKYLMIISLGLAGVISLTSDWIISLLYGSAYAEASAVLRIAVWSLVFTFVNGTLISAIAAVDREREGSNRLFLGLFFSALSNLAVIPFYGQIGAAATTVMARAFVFYLELHLLRKALPDLKLPAVGRLIIATLAMVTVGWFCRPAGLVVTVIVPAIVYLGLLMVTRTIKREEWSTLMKLLRWQSTS